MSSAAPAESLRVRDDGDPVSQIPESEEATISATRVLRKRPPSHLHSVSDVPDLKRSKSSTDLASPLMSLPSEIRVKILRLLLCSDMALEIACSGKFICNEFHHPKRHCDEWESPERAARERRKHFPVRSYILYPAILLVNRALYNEGKPVLYEQNTMSVRVHAQKPRHGPSKEDCSVTMLDHSNATGTGEMNSWHSVQRPSPAPQLFHNLDIDLRVEPGYHRYRLKRTLQELTMRLNGEYPSGRPRKLTLMFTEPQEVGECAMCHKMLRDCEQSKHCPGPKVRRQASAQNASKYLSLFRYLKDVSEVSLLTEVDNADKLTAELRGQQRGPDLFPLYWAFLCYVQRLPDDLYTEKAGLRWETECSGDGDWKASEPDFLAAEGLQVDGNDPHEFCMGPETYHWTCRPWLRHRMRDLGLAVDRCDEETFHLGRRETKALISLVMGEVRDSLIYQFEGGRPPYGDTDMAGYESDPEMGGKLEMVPVRVFDQDGQRRRGNFSYSFGRPEDPVSEEKWP